MKVRFRATITSIHIDLRKKTIAATSDLPPPVLPAAPPSEDKIVSTQFIDTGEENAQIFAVSKSVETVEQAPVTAPHETVTEVVSEVDAHHDGEDVAVSGEDDNVKDSENVLLSEREPEAEARPKENEKILMKEETTSVVHEREETGKWLMTLLSNILIDYLKKKN